MAPSPEKVGLVGTGLLGSALAERLLEAGFDTVVCDRVRGKAAPLIKRGAAWSDNPFTECKRVILCLFNSQDVAEVLASLGNAISAGHIVVDTTTGTPEQAIGFAQQLADRNAAYLESPIAASSEQTRQGAALAMVAGDKAAFLNCQDIYDAIAPSRYHVGKAGNAAKMKLVNNLVLGLTRVAIAEGLAFAETLELPMDEVMQVLTNGNAHSVALDVKGEKMINRDYQLQAKLSQHLKDVRLILSEADQRQLKLPFSELHQATLSQLEDAGYGDQDNSAIIEAFRKD